MHAIARRAGLRAGWLIGVLGILLVAWAPTAAADDGDDTTAEPDMCYSGDFATDNDYTATGVDPVAGTLFVGVTVTLGKFQVWAEVDPLACIPQ